jgi:hypothetical protein
MSFSGNSRGVAVSPVAWLKSVMTADAAAADQIRGAETLVAEVSPGLAGGLGGADPAWAFASAGEAQATQEGVGQICAHHCPIRKRCVTDACRFYRLEQAADDYLAGDTEWIEGVDL